MDYTEHTPRIEALEEATQQLQRDHAALEEIVRANNKEALRLHDHFLTMSLQLTEMQVTLTKILIDKPKWL